MADFYLNWYCASYHIIPEESLLEALNCYGPIPQNRLDVFDTVLDVFKRQWYFYVGVLQQ